MFKLFRFLKPFHGQMIIVLALVFLQSISEVYLPTLMSNIVDIGIVNGDIDYIIKIGRLMLIIAAAGSSALILSSYMSAKIASGFGKMLRKSVFAHIESFSLQEFDKIGTASLITRTTNDITQMQQVVIMALRMGVRAPMMIIGGIIMAVSKDAKLALLIVLVIPIIFVIIFVISRKGVPLFRLLQLKLDNLNRVFRENLTGIRVIRAFNRIDYEQRRFSEANRDFTSTAIKVNKLMATLWPILMLVLNYTIIAVIWWGSIRINNGDLQVGDLMAFIQYVMQIMFALIMLSMIFIMFPRVLVSASRISEVLDTYPGIKEPETVKHIYNHRGAIELRHVTFRYPGTKDPAIKDVSFITGPGEVTAIIGSTGSGKSTLVNLIPRFYDIDSGSIMINGMDIREMSLSKLRSRIGMVPQDVILFSGTISDNIRYGKEDASEAEIYDAAEKAQATEFIAELEHGFDSFIAQGGTNISGGQKQRLAIARALVRKPEIYVFDDSFSALDFKTDAKLRAVLDQETAGSAVLIVAQRVSTLMNADQIIVMDNGSIAGMGRHKELLETCEVYREIVASQLSEEETA